jgi:hypothetical protein
MIRIQEPKVVKGRAQLEVGVLFSYGMGCDYTIQQIKDDVVLANSYDQPHQIYQFTKKQVIPCLNGANSIQVRIALDLQR